MAPDHDDLSALRAENARLIALLESRGIMPAMALPMRR